VVVNLPTSREIQTKIASKIEAIAEEASRAEDEYRAKLDDIDDLRQSLLQKAFVGELT